jgi:hypothetical protein
MSAANPEGKRALLLRAHVLTVANEKIELFIEPWKDVLYISHHSHMWMSNLDAHIARWGHPLRPCGYPQVPSSPTGNKTMHSSISGVLPCRLPRAESAGTGASPSPYHPKVNKFSEFYQNSLKFDRFGPHRISKSMILRFMDLKYLKNKKYIKN